MIKFEFFKEFTEGNINKVLRELCPSQFEETLSQICTSCRRMDAFS